jgi:ADP-dependent NAD(P)H-hydrate dehydratase / NAD(P)H-hydrate epimerase
MKRGIATMWKYVSVAEMVAIEKEADASGLTYELMMENAGSGLADVIAREYFGIADRGILGLVGSGNNGGDTLVALALLAREGWRATAYLIRQRPQDDPLVERLQQVGGNIYSISNDQDFQVLVSQIKSNSVVMDGVLGTGTRLPLKQDLATALAFIRDAVKEIGGGHVVAVDCPSGVDCDTGEAPSETIPAELTVTMAAIKQGLLHFPAYQLAGKIEVVGIGLGENKSYPETWEDIQRIVPDSSMIQNILPRRPLDAHKGTFGTALIVAGSVNYTGAAWLAGRAAYKIGAGLVTMAIPHPLHAILAGQFPEATWLLLPDEMGVIASDAGSVLREGFVQATALLVGPGLGVEETTKHFIENLFSSALPGKKSGMGLVPPKKIGGSSEPTGLPPLVLDADGLKLAAQMPDWPRRLPALTILTPHPGEMSILTGLTVSEIQRSRVAVAEQYAKEWGHVVVLKGAFTVIASPGGDTAVIPIATAALARAGTGDVLAGLIVGLRAQGMEAYPAAVAGAWIHAKTGLRASERLGSTMSVLAGDVLNSVESVISDLHL